MLFVVIERFADRNPEPVYRRLRGEGRMMPDALSYEGSWVQADFDKRFPLTECENVADLQRWVANWHDVIDSEIVPFFEGA